MWNCVVGDNNSFGCPGTVLDVPAGSHADQSEVELVNCTIANNTNELATSSVRLSRGTLLIRNSIVWGNQSPQIDGNLQDVTVEYSNIQGGWNGAGSNNLDVDPQFAGTQPHPYQLTDGSPCVDAGENGFVPNDVYQVAGEGADPEEPISIDLIGNDRFVDWTGTPVPVVDMGAYELVCEVGDCEGDLNDDGVVDGADLLIMLQNWGVCADPGNCPGDLNADGVVDGADLLILLSNWGDCESCFQVFAPQTLEDCYERYAEDTQEFLACVFAVEELQAMQESD